MKWEGNPRGKHVRRSPRTPDPRFTKPYPSDDMAEATKLYQRPCRFWKIGKCNWGWGCRFFHGSSCQEDPRHPDYRGAAVDFTQFPRPAAAGYFSPQSPLHPEDQSRVKPLRNPVVQILIACPQAGQSASQFKEALLRGGCDLLGEEPLQSTREKADEKVVEKAADFFVFVELGRVVVLPGEAPVTAQNVADVVKRMWDITNHNLSSDYIELMTRAELEKIITELTSLDNISSTVVELQNETANAMSAMMLNDGQIPPQIPKLEQKVRTFFGKLNLANSTIADIPLHAASQATRGEVVSVVPPRTSALSVPMQRMLSYIVEQHLTQIHMCLAHLNRMQGETAATATTSFALVTPTSPALHPTPLCAPCTSVVCSDQPPRARVEIGRRIEPEVAVDMRTPYSISFRESNGMDINPFSQFSRHGNP